MTAKFAMSPGSMQQIRVAADVGTGRAFIILREENEYSEFATALTEALRLRSRILHCECAAVHDQNWSQLTDSLRELLRIQGVRQCSLIGFGAAAAVVQNFVLTEPRGVRTLTVVDAETRPHSTLKIRMADRLESYLPLGLPLRLKSAGFDSRPFLQRLRCPALVVVTDIATKRIREEAEHFISSMPTAWGCTVAGPGAASALADRVVAFQDVPARCPQKRSVA